MGMGIRRLGNHTGRENSGSFVAQISQHMFLLIIRYYNYYLRGLFLFFNWQVTVLHATGIVFRYMAGHKGNRGPNGGKVVFEPIVFLL